MIKSKSHLEPGEIFTTGAFLREDIQMADNRFFYTNIVANSGENPYAEPNLMRK
jgi:hypothetical protein